MATGYAFQNKTILTACFTLCSVCHAVEKDDPIDIAPKIIRTNVFPLAMLLALMLLWYILKWIMKRFFRPLFQRCLTIVSCGCCGSFGGTSFEARRPEYNPPFTGRTSLKAPLTMPIIAAPVRRSAAKCEYFSQP